MKGVASHSSDICHIVHRLLLSGKWKWNGSPNLWAWEKRWKNSDIQQEDLCFACFNSNLTGAVNLDICLWLILLMSWCVLCFTLSPIHHYQFLNIMNLEIINWGHLWSIRSITLSMLLSQRSLFLWNSYSCFLKKTSSGIQRWLTVCEGCTTVELWRTVKDMRARSHFQPFLATFQVYVSANTVHSVTLNTVLSEF